jgi:hypothetical protein
MILIAESIDGAWGRQPGAAHRALPHPGHIYVAVGGQRKLRERRRAADGLSW